MILSSDLIYEFIWGLLGIIYLVFKVNFWLLYLFNTINVHCWLISKKGVNINYIILEGDFRVNNSFFILDIS